MDSKPRVAAFQHRLKRIFKYIFLFFMQQASFESAWCIESGPSSGLHELFAPGAHDGTHGHGQYWFTRGLIDIDRTFYSCRFPRSV